MRKRNNADNRNRVFEKGKDTEEQAMVQDMVKGNIKSILTCLKSLAKNVNSCFFVLLRRPFHERDR